ncbi:MAG: hypothetical protein H0X04_01960 [Chthoniobacterales bacterium]|nr:hypothetical protein [Chthoniobacterales bacterium]
MELKNFLIAFTSPFIPRLGLAAVVLWVVPVEDVELQLVFLARLRTSTR